MKTRTRLLVILISAIITSAICLRINEQTIKPIKVIEIPKDTVIMGILTNKPSPLPVPTPKR